MNDPDKFQNRSEKEIFFEALEKNTPEERTAFLDGACGKDLALRARMEALLAEHFEQDTFMKKPAAYAERPTIKISPIEEAAGTVIGRYKLLQCIGEGGCGVVYMAEQQEPVRRRVALKVIKLGMDTKQVIARFEAERQALALMDHPNIAKVLDAGATETGRPYFVMELVKGIPITRYCDENNLSTATRLSLFVQVCQAIQHAHQKGIIHRDIKPSNILVADHDGVPLPKIIDFGIAKATTDQRLTDKTLFTAFEQFIGTPAYMSPEQARLSGLDIDTRSDIYSLGVLLYELLTGRTPFEGERLLKAGLDEIRRIIREEEPVRPSTRLHTLDAVEQTTVARHRQADPPKLRHLLSGDLDWIVMKALEKDRGRRYETANGLAMDIQRHLNNEPVLARPPGKLYRFQKMARRNKLAFGAAAAVVTSLALGLVICSFLFIREKQARASEAAMRQKAEAANQQAQAQAARAVAASRQAKSAEQNARQKEVEAKTALSTSEFLQGSRAITEKHPGDALAYLARSFADDPANEAALTSMATLLASHSWMAPTVLLKPAKSANSAQFSPDGKRILTVSEDWTAQVWDAQSGQPLTRLGLGGQVGAAQFSPDGTRVVTATWDQARVWDASSGQPLTPPLPHNGLVASAQFSPDGRRLVTMCGASAWVWDAQDGRKLAELQTGGKLSLLLAQFSPDGSSIITAAWDQVRVWDAKNGRVLTMLPQLGSSFARSAQFSPDGKRIVTASGDGSARVWDAQSGQQLMTLRHILPVASAQFSPDGKSILTTTWGGTVQIYDAQSGQLLPGHGIQDNRVNSAQFSPDGTRIVTASGAVARGWNARSGQPLTEPLQHNSVVNSAQFSPDGKRILTVSGSAAQVWDVRSGLPLTEPLQHAGLVSSAQFSPDGKRIVTAAEDGTARVWDAQTGQPLMEPLFHGWEAGPGEFKRSAHGERVVGMTWPVNSVQFSPDGKRIITAAQDGNVRIWDIAPSPAPPPSWLPQLAEAISGQTLNPQGLLEPTHLNPAEVIGRLRKTVGREPDNDDWAVWGRWFFADPFTRTISPFSSQTVPEYIEERITEQTPESLAEAERLAGDNAPLLKRIAEARGRLDQTTHALALKRDADALVAQGKFAEAEPKYHEALEIIRQVSGPQNPDTTSTMRSLANLYCSLGRRREALTLLDNVCAMNPQDTDASLTLATWQTWFGQDADYEASRRRLVQEAQGTDLAGTAERAAKAFCLRPSTDTALLTNALNLAQRAVELGKYTGLLPWYQLGLGLAEYRNGQCAAAERSLTVAEKTVGDSNRDIQGIARLFRAMSLFRQGRSEEARWLFNQEEAQMAPLPKDETKPLLNGHPVSHDVLIWWLAYKEARSLLSPPGDAKP